MIIYSNWKNLHQSCQNVTHVKTQNNVVILCYKGNCARPVHCRIFSDKNIRLYDHNLDIFFSVKKNACKCTNYC